MNDAKKNASELVDSGELVRLLLDSTGEGIYGIDLQGNCTFANPACATLLGYDSVDELLGQQMHKLIHHTRANGEHYPVEECQIYQAFHKGEGTHVDDEVMFCADGKPFPCEYWSYPMRRDGEVIGCVVTFIDISDRRRAEELKARHSATLERVARFPEMNPGPVLRLKSDGDIRLANQAACDVFGDDIVGCNWLDLVPELDAAAWEDILQATEVVRVECNVGQKHFTFAHRRDFDDDLVFAFGTDITEAKEAERGLREAHELVQSLLNSTGEGIYGIDLEGNCTFSNPACASLLGFASVDDLLGQHMHKLVHHTRPNGEPYPVEECRIYQAFHKGEGTHIDDELLFRADGESFPAEYWSYPMIHDDELIGCVVTFVDITERRRVEEELRQTEKMAALGKLSAGLAHELNNPAAAASRAANQIREGIDDLQATTIELAQIGIGPEVWTLLTSSLEGIRQRSTTLADLSPLEASDREEEILEWLEQQDVDNGWMIAPVFVSVGLEVKDLDEFAKKLEAAHLPMSLTWLCRAITAADLSTVVERSSKSISELVNTVKSYSHMDKAPTLCVDIHDGLEDTIAIMHHKLKRGVDVIRDYDRSLPQVMAQGSELNQVWTNLIDNAVSAMDGKGKIEIKTHLVDSAVTVVFTDNGPGIPAEIQKRIFEPFFTTKDVGEGTGLGLDVVNRIVTNRCGGRIDLTSKPGNTTFTVRIPVDLDCEAPQTD